MPPFLNILSLHFLLELIMVLFFYLPNFLTTIDFFFPSCSNVSATWLWLTCSNLSVMFPRNLLSRALRPPAWVWAACSVQLSSGACPPLLFWTRLGLPSCSAAFEQSALLLTPSALYVICFFSLQTFRTFLSLVSWKFTMMHFGIHLFLYGESVSFSYRKMSSIISSLRQSLEYSLVKYWTSWTVSNFLTFLMFLLSEVFIFQPFY